MYPVERIAALMPEQTAGSAPDLVAAITMTGAKVAQDTLGLTGAGVKVGIIDTGIDIDHPAFGGNGSPGSTAFPTARIVTGWDFVGDAYDSSTNPATVPDANPDDCNGHGTHVGGIVGANGGKSGCRTRRETLAPTASSAAKARRIRTSWSPPWRWCWRDGTEVLNQSIGSRPASGRSTHRAGGHAPGQQRRRGGGVDRQRRARSGPSPDASVARARRAWATG